MVPNGKPDSEGRAILSLPLLRLPEIRNETKMTEPRLDGRGFPAKVFCYLRIRLFLIEHLREKRVVLLAPRPAHIGIFFAKFLDARNPQGDALRVYLLWAWLFCSDSAKKILLKFFLLTLRQTGEFFACRIRVAAKVPVGRRDFRMQFQRALVESFEK